MPKRILSIRITTKLYSIDIVSAYAPGEHLPEKDKDQFWKKLQQHIAQTPNRTQPIIGIDANGHIGKITHIPNIYPVGSTKWTQNGSIMSQICCRYNLMVTNCQIACKHPGPTWWGYSGTVSTKVDYILIPLRLGGGIKNNIGADPKLDLNRQGSPTDHIPVRCTFTIPIYMQQYLSLIHI